MQVHRLKVPLTRLCSYEMGSAVATYVDPAVIVSDLLNGGLTTYDVNNINNYATDPVLRCGSPNDVTDMASAVANASYFYFTMVAVTGTFLPRMYGTLAARGGSSNRGWGLRSDDDSYTADLFYVNPVTTQRPNWTAYNVPLTIGAKSAITFRNYIVTPGPSLSLEQDNITVWGILL